MLRKPQISYFHVQVRTGALGLDKKEKERKAESGHHGGRRAINDNDNDSSTSKTYAIAQRRRLSSWRRSL